MGDTGHCWEWVVPTLSATTCHMCNCSQWNQRSNGKVNKLTVVMSHDGFYPANKQNELHTYRARYEPYIK